MPISVISTHMVIKLTVTKDELGWAAMEDDGFKNSVKQDGAAEKSAVGNLLYDADNSLVLADTETFAEIRYDGSSGGRIFGRRKIEAREVTGKSVVEIKYFNIGGLKMRFAKRFLMAATLCVLVGGGTFAQGQRAAATRPARSAF